MLNRGENMRNAYRLRAGVSVICLLSACVAGQALAQSASAAAASSDSAPTHVDEIVVTAQKRTQSLQDVPIVVTTVSHQLIQDTGIKDIKDLALLTPGLLVTSTTSEASTTARIRGIGTVGDNPGLESSVGVVIDGVFRSRNGVGFGDLGDVDQIEVLKGPQGTLFGKSTSAGVINVVTAAPKFKYGANAEFTASNYGGYGGSAEITGPLVADKLAGSLYFSDRQRDGYFDVNHGSGPEHSHFRHQSRLLHHARPAAGFAHRNLTLRFIADYSQRVEECCIAVITRGGPSHGPGFNALGGNDGNPADPTPATPIPIARTRQKITDGGVSLQADYKFPSLNAALTSITALS